MKSSFVYLLAWAILAPAGVLLVQADSVKKSGPGDLKAKDAKESPAIVAFYLERYRAFLDSPGMVSLVKSKLPSDKMTETEKLFYTSGFLRGILEYASYETYKEAPEQACIHDYPLGKNAGFEKAGWRAGCTAGREKGDSIMREYQEYLKSK